MKDLGSFIGSYIITDFADSTAGMVKKIGVVMKGCYPECGYK
jgi:hypothetical protein